MYWHRYTHKITVHLDCKCENELDTCIYWKEKSKMITVTKYWKEISTLYIETIDSFNSQAHSAT